nr:immunoglobulin heavy chain junction region [Macaca mulatta]
CAREYCTGIYCQGPGNYFDYW